MFDQKTISESDVLIEFLQSSKNLISMVIEDMSIEEAQLVRDEIKKHQASITLSTTLSGPPAVFGYLTYGASNRKAQEIFRVVAGDLKRSVDYLH